MRVRIPSLAIVGVVVLFTGGVACGNDEQLTVEEYFRALDVEDDAYGATISEREDELFEEMQRAETFEEELAGFREFTEDGTEALEDFVNGIDALSPPDELQDLHDRLVAAIEAGIDSLDDVVVALSDVSTEEEMQTVLMEGGTEESFLAMSAVCKEAQTLADDADVDVDFECGEEEE